MQNLEILDKAASKEKRTFSPKSSSTLFRELEALSAINNHRDAS
jgi:hypothetical protein